MTASSIDFGRHVGGVVAENAPEHQVNGAVLFRIGSSDNDWGIEESCVSHRHAGFNAVALRLNRGRDHTAVRGVVGGDNDWFSAKEGISLLFNRGKARVKIDVHDCRRVVIEG